MRTWGAGRAGPIPAGGTVACGLDHSGGATLRVYPANPGTVNPYRFDGARRIHDAEEATVAKTQRGTKIVSVPAHTRKGPGGKTIKVDPHKRSTPN